MENRGQFVLETLVPACQKLEQEFIEAWADSSFRSDPDLLRDYAGRPSLLTECHNLGSRLGIRVLLKRKISIHRFAQDQQRVGLVLLAKRMGRKRIVAETGAGQHCGCRYCRGFAWFGVQGVHG